MATLLGDVTSTVSYNADTVFPTASVIKAAIVAEAFVQQAEGRLSLDQTIEVGGDDLIGGSGILAELTTGLIFPLRDLALLAIMVSDNTASNLVLRAVGGPEPVNCRMQEAWGMTDTVIHRPIKFHLEPGDPQYTATSTPRDMCQLMTLLAGEKIHSPEVSHAVYQLLGTVRDTSMLPRHLTVNAYAQDLEAVAPIYTVAHKAGAVLGVRNDAGIIRHGPTGRQLAVCVYTKGVADDRWTVENRGECAVADVARLLCSHFFE